MTHRSHGRGSFVLDRVFPGLGRIRRASGTTQKRVYEALNGMLSTLWSTGRHDVLEAIRDGAIHPLTVLAQLRDRGPASLPRPVDLREVKPLMEAWAKALEPDRRRYMGEYVAALFKVIPVSTKLVEIPDAMRAYRAAKTATPVQHNRTKYAVQAFLRATVGRRHPVYQDVADIRKLAERRKAGSPFTPDELAVVTAKLRQPFAGMIWTMVLSGMGPKEYWGRWSAVGDRVAIHGTKTRGRDRLVPVLGPVVRPGCSWSHFKLVFRDAAPGHAPYDLRRSFARWLEEAGVPPSRIRAYMGHRPQSVTDLYQRHDVEPYLLQDGKLMRRWIRQHGGRLRVVGDNA